jgi:hypothetical protein
MPETSGDSRRGVSGILFPAIHGSFTTQGPRQKGAGPDRFRIDDTGAPRLRATLQRRAKSLSTAARRRRACVAGP